MVGVFWVFCGFFCLLGGGGGAHVVFSCLVWFCLVACMCFVFSVGFFGLFGTCVFWGDAFIVTQLGALSSQWHKLQPLRECNAGCLPESRTHLYSKS